MERAPDTPSDAQRAAELRRMQTLATGLLIAMAAVFAASSLAIARGAGLAFGLGYVRAFAEAAVVGACADWFAVTALFRRPLGLPIPHTGLIPRNKQRIGEALGGFIAENFLTEAVLEGKLRQFELARWGARWLRQEANASALAERITTLIPELLNMTPADARRDFFAAATGSVVRALPAAPLAAGLARAVWSEGRARAILDRGLDALARYIAEREEMIRTMVAGRTFKWLPKWVDGKIADKVVSALGEILQEMRAPDHPWRTDLSAAVERFIDRLETDPALRTRAEALKRTLLEDPRVLGQFAQILTSALSGPGFRDLEAAFTRALISFGEWLDEDEPARATLNAWMRAAATQVIAPRRREIGRFIAGVVEGWDTRSIVEKLELQVGRDLQFIRVNGTVVGGLVGLALYAVSRALGLGGS